MNNNNNRTSKAKRRPEDISRSSQSSRIRSSQPESRYNVKRSMNGTPSAMRTRQGNISGNISGNIADSYRGAARRNVGDVKRSVSENNNVRSSKSVSAQASRSTGARAQTEKQNNRAEKNPVSRFVSFLRNELLYGRILKMNSADRQRSAERREQSSDALTKYYDKESEYQNSHIRVRGGMDLKLFFALFIIVSCGLVTVYSATYPSYGASYFLTHLRNIAVGLAAGFIMYILPMGFIKNIGSWVGFLGSLALLVAILIPGVAKQTSAGDVQRWIDLGFMDLQPSEVMKLGLTLFLAWYYDRYDRSIHMRVSGREIRPIVYNFIYPFIIGASALGLVIEGKHLSGAVIIGVIFAAILVASKTEWKYIAVFALIALLFVFAYISRNEYASKRFIFKYDNTEDTEVATVAEGTEGAEIAVSSDDNTVSAADTADEVEEEDPNALINDNNRQSLYSKYAIGSGGFWGKGLGNSRIKNGYLYGAHTDFIFAIVGEEGGFVISATLILLYLVVIYRGAIIAIKAPDIYSMLVATGITAQIGIQAWLNIFVTFGELNTGIGLPFFSYGGSSMLVMFAEAGLLLKISKQSFIKQSELIHEETAEDLGLK